MNLKLVELLIQLALSKNYFFQKVEYIFKGIIYYGFLAKDSTFSSNKSEADLSSQAGDDIYPLF
jgi:hypothetical protein